MATHVTGNLDYLAARLHGRRSRMAERARLDALCGLRSVADLSRTRFFAAPIEASTEFQRALAQEVVRELWDFMPQLSGRGAELLRWILVRYQVENLKVLARGFATRKSYDELRPHLIDLPGDLPLHGEWPPADVADAAPAGPLRDALQSETKPTPFFLEAALDHAYQRELLARVDALPPGDRAAIRPWAGQEADIAHLRLVIRGRFGHGLAAADLSPFHVEGAAIPRAMFQAMLADADWRTAARRMVGRVIDALPAGDDFDPSALEALAFVRFLRTANQAFRRAPTGLGAVIGYAALRRVEVANLITVSEGIRANIGEDMLRSRLTPRRQEALLRA
jgi:vacuolar-type H+-ATPase subunit C/Vma6